MVQYSCRVSTVAMFPSLTAWLVYISLLQPGIVYLVLGASNTSCPTGLYYNTTTNKCQCDEFLMEYHYVSCNQQRNRAYINSGVCLTTGATNNSFTFGMCPLTIGNWKNITNRLWSELPSDHDMLNATMCGPYNREGLLCGKCIGGYGLPVYSLDVKCINCSRLSMKILYQISFAFTEFWALTFFRSLIPPFCISEKLTSIHVQLLTVVPPIYVVLLVFSIFALIELHARNCKAFQKPFVSFRCCSSDDIIRAFATFTFLSSTAVILSVFMLSLKIHIQSSYIPFITYTTKPVLYIDPSVVYYSHEHILYLITWLAAARTTGYTRNCTTGFLFFALSLVVAYVKPCKSTLANLSLSYHAFMLGVLEFGFLFWSDLSIGTEALELTFILIPLLSHTFAVFWAVYSISQYIKRNWTDLSSVLRCVNVRNRNGYQQLPDSASERFLKGFAVSSMQFNQSKNRKDQ